MISIVGKVVGQFHMSNRETQALAANSYRRNPNAPEFPFGKEVTLIVIRDYECWILSRTGERYWGRKSGGAGYNGIVLGPKFNADGSVNERTIGIGTGNEVFDFQIDPNTPEVDGHATLIFAQEHPNDFTEITGKWIQAKLS